MRYAPSGAAIDELRNRIDAGLGNYQWLPFQPRSILERWPVMKKKKTSIYRLFRETGRHLSTMPIGAGDEVVFAGCWLVKSQQRGTLHALGDTGKILDGFNSLELTKICQKTGN